VSVLLSAGVHRCETQVLAGEEVSWLKIDDGFAEHPKIQDLADRTFRLHVVAMCYCARNLTDGVVSERSLRVIAAIIGAARVTRNVEQLVSAGLWIPVGGGHRIKDFLEYNPTAERVKEERLRNRERQQRHRERNASRNAVTNDAPTRPVPINQELSKATDVEKEFFKTAREWSLHHSKIVKALRLGEAGVAFAMDKVKRRGDVANKAAYFDTTVKDMLAAMEAGGSARSEMPLEDRLRIYVRNAGWELTHSELAEDLIAYCADLDVVGRLLVEAEQLRTEAA
jgi:hypothetical protein